MPHQRGEARHHRVEAGPHVQGGRQHRQGMQTLGERYHEQRGRD